MEMTFCHSLGNYKCGMMDFFAQNIRHNLPCKMIHMSISYVNVSDVVSEKQQNGI